VSQCQCQGIESVFSSSLAEQQLRRLRRRGPQKTTRLLLEALRARGVPGRSLLDIGGGVGVIQHELLAAGLSEATSVDASSAYLAASRAEAEHLGYRDRVRYHFGNFVDLASGIPPADIVTLDRVICCYDDMETLVRLSTARAVRLYGVVYPRSSWWVRLGTSAANLIHGLRGSTFRIFSHKTASVEAITSAQGLARVFHRNAGMWQVALFARDS
jgi:2-polyprenyl-3-methyl-5-hydroxy-6-metoxy-1,4-benzoquinol methylase